MNSILRNPYQMMIATLVLTAALFTPITFAQSAEDIQALQDQINELNRKLEALKAQQEASQAAATTEPKAEPAGNDFRVHWKEGLCLDSNNGDFKLKFGGRIQNDFAWFSEGDDIKNIPINSQDGTEFRRARLYIGGTIYEDFEFKAQYDFAGSSHKIKDMYIAANNVPVVGQIKVGHFKEPFSLENLTSSKDIGMMERNLSTAFAPGYGTGIGIANSAYDKHLAYAAGIFRHSDSQGAGASDSGGVDITGRISGVPIWDAEGERYLHLGLGLSHLDVDSDGEYDLDSSAEAHLAEDLVMINMVDVDSVDMIGLEVAYAQGTLHLQSEYIFTCVGGESGIEDADFSGYYVQVGYFLTGEHKNYKLGKGVFDKIRPNNNFTLSEGGTGAWEVLVRYSNLDLEDGSYAGGELSDITLGINWYLNPNMKVMLNYVHGELEDGVLGDGEEDDVDYIMTRFQVTW